MMALQKDKILTQRSPLGEDRADHPIKRRRTVVVRGSLHRENLVGRRHSNFIPGALSDMGFGARLLRKYHQKYHQIVPATADYPGFGVQLVN
ncbi:hypothetical protein BGV54_12955 [Burkholderia ubonensis]|uniref:hypothetical protein n=1 Tax=Burkholderia ubonensis TaxID=101571 RepID=UPI0008FDE392|nr:hypothetical protein [Burkholderia ubonensis]OJB24455.1 hypothetical protein BGV54_12955 [Burkholderia ubonensis]